MTDTDIVWAANTSPTNGQLIEQIAQLGYIDPTMYTLDPTYGKGSWWTRWEPAVMEKHDIALDGTDFRQLPYTDRLFDLVAFDPPYIAAAKGKRPVGEFDIHDRYGLHDIPNTPAGLQQLINDGMSECARVLDHGGILLVKCMDYIKSGRLWPGTWHTQNHGYQLQLELVDRIEHIAAKRPQPHKRQVHARRNLSTLFVWSKP